MSFKTGDKIVRIGQSDSPNSNWRGQRIEIGEIHTVRSVCQDSAYPDTTVILLEGIYNPANPHSGKEYGYDPKLWALVHEPLTGFVEMTYTKIIEQIPIGQS